MSPWEPDLREPAAHQQDLACDPRGPLNIPSKPVPAHGLKKINNTDMDMWLMSRATLNVFNQRKNDVMSCSNAPSSEYDNQSIKFMSMKKVAGRPKRQMEAPESEEQNDQRGSHDRVRENSWQPNESKATGSEQCQVLLRGSDDNLDEGRVSNQPQDAISWSKQDPCRKSVEQINKDIAAQGSNSKNGLIENMKISSNNYSMPASNKQSPLRSKNGLRLPDDINFLGQEPLELPMQDDNDEEEDVRQSHGLYNNMQLADMAADKLEDPRDLFGGISRQKRK